MMHRRNFLGGAMAGASALATASRGVASTRGDVPTRVFGKTGERLTVIGQAGGRFPLCTFEQAKAITLRAYDLGINYFDNAHGYWNGRSEEVFGEVLPQVRKDVFITTKSTQRTREGAEKELHLSLRRLKTDYVDLWQIHAVGEMDEVDQIFGPGGAIEAFEAAKKAGKCRFIGFTGHRDPHVHLAMLERYGEYDTILMPLHAADPAYLSFEKPVLEPEPDSLWAAATQPAGRSHRVRRPWSWYSFNAIDQEDRNVVVRRWRGDAERIHAGRGASVLAGAVAASIRFH